MLIKENSSTKTIEDKMNFKFEDLILIGKKESLYMDRIFYKSDKNVLMFSLYDSKEICVIEKITNLQTEYDKMMKSLKINKKEY